MTYFSHWFGTCAAYFTYFIFKPCTLVKLFQIEDARAAMMLYQKNRKAWERTVKDQIKLKLKQKKRKPKKKIKAGCHAVPAFS